MLITDVLEKSILTGLYYEIYILCQKIILRRFEQKFNSRDLARVKSL